MSFFYLFESGFHAFIYQHIFEHLLFLVALCCVYTLNSWKTVLPFVLFFIVGYLITFLTQLLGIAALPAPTIKLLLPVTVFAIAFANFFVKKKTFTNRYPSQNFRFYFALIAGLIHGFAFKAPASDFVSVWAYNLGVISCILLASFGLLTIALFFTYFLRIRLREWSLIISGACMGIALYNLFLIVG